MTRFEDVQREADHLAAAAPLAIVHADGRTFCHFRGGRCGELATHRGNENDLHLKSGLGWFGLDMWHRQADGVWVHGRRTRRRRDRYARSLEALHQRLDRANESKETGPIMWTHAEPLSQSVELPARFRCPKCDRVSTVTIELLRAAVVHSALTPIFP